MARVAPTSLVFGVWDSRDTQAKLPRLVSSTIRAFDVQRLRRSAQYNPPIDYASHEVFSEEDKAKAEGDPKNPLAKRGFVHVPAVGSHGGVIAKGGIRRDATLSLAALRLLTAGQNSEETLKLRRYILGLSLVAFTANASTYLRQGTNLVPDIDVPRTLTQVNSDGKRPEFTVTHADAIDFARVAAKAFGVNQEKLEVEFDKNLAKTDVTEGESKAVAKAAAKKAAAEAKKVAKATNESATDSQASTEVR
jgi:CRISPR-associated protein Csb1